MSTGLTGIEEFRQELQECSNWARDLREGREQPGLWAKLEQVLAVAEADRRALLRAAGE